MTFYIQTWDEYHTHTLTLGIISGPVEGILTLCIVYAFTAYQGGASYWHRAMLPELGVPASVAGVEIPKAIYNMAFWESYIWYGGFVLAFNTYESVTNVIRVRKERGEKYPHKALLGLIPLTLTWLYVPAYLYLQPVIRTQHIVPFVFFVGLINAYSVGQIITAHLCKSRFPYHNILLLPLGFGILDSLAPILGLWPSSLGDGVYQVGFVFMSLGLAIGVYGSFVVSFRSCRVSFSREHANL